IARGQTSVARFRRNFSRARCQSPTLSISHLVARCLSNGADWCIDGVDRRAFEDGCLRIHPPARAAFPEGNQNRRAMAARARDLLDRLRAARGLGPTRPQTNDCLLVDQSARLLAD